MSELSSGRPPGEKKLGGCLIHNAGGPVTILLVEFAASEHARADGGEVAVALTSLKATEWFLRIRGAVGIELRSEAGQRGDPGIGGRLDAGTRAQKIRHGTIQSHDLCRVLFERLELGTHLHHVGWIKAG